MNLIQEIQNKGLQNKGSGKICRGFYLYKIIVAFFISLFAFLPTVFAENTFVFSTDQQSIAVGETSGKINVQSSVPVTETTYLTFTSSSPTGQFLTSSGNPLTTAYISNGDSNRAVYYKDITAGDFIITATVLNKEKNQELAKITQHIYIGQPSGSDYSNNASDTPSTNTNQNEGTSSSQSSNTSAHSSPESLSNIENKMEFEISAGRDRLTSVGGNVLFKASATKLQNISANNIIYSWSFGDGTSGVGQSINHTYRFAGEYAVVVNASYSDKSAVSRLIVKVIDPKISIKRLPGGIEVNNSSNAEINLEGWSLKSMSKTFTFPTDTLVPSGKKIIFADEVTGINSGNVDIENPLSKKYFEISDNLTTQSTSTVDVATEINKAYQTIAIISSKINEIKNDKTTNSNDIIEDAKDIVYSNDKPVLDMVLKDDSKKLFSNTAVVYEAPQSKSLINKIFAWPIAGVNFIRDLFVEK